MGQDAFVGRYGKPNYRLHVVVFVAIVAVSIILATQVEKTKGKAGIAAFKAPVPIDSIGIVKSNAQENVPTIKSPVINKNLSATSKAADTITNQEYVFDDGSNLESINQLLATDDTDVNADLSSLESEKIPETENKPESKDSPDSMDHVYEKQQDRFLETLAKSAELETQESIDLKQLKEAIRSDKPLIRTNKTSSNTIAAKTSKNKLPSKKTTNQKQDHNTDGVKIATLKTLTVKPQSLPVNKQDLQKASLITNKHIASTNKIEMPVMTKGELDRVMSQFAHSYNEGDINRLMALFADNASTNDRRNKIGIKADYAELFNNTQTRKLMIKDVKWQFGKDKAEGAADFVVTVQPKNSAERNLYKGYIKITAIKQSKGVYITRLVHELKQ